jgi:cytidylate kinase
VARQVAKRLGYTHIDTGSIYRSIALLSSQFALALDQKLNYRLLADLANDATVELQPDGKVILSGTDVSKDIRDPSISIIASEVAKNAEIRKIVMRKQRELGTLGGIVVEGER